MKRNFKDIWVDAGIIMIFDEKMLESYGGLREDNTLHGGKSITLKPGNYDVKWKIPNSYFGVVEGEGNLKVETGNVLVIDPCYVVGDWDKFLKETDMINNPPEGTVLLDKHGGDGSFQVNVNFVRV